MSRVSRNLANLFGLLALSAPLFSFTNLVPVSVAFAPLGLLAVFSRRAIAVLLQIWPLSLFAVYALVSTLLYDSTSLLEYDFYRRDGNFFITFFFLASVITFCLHARAETSLRVLCIVSTVIFIVLAPIQLVALDMPQFTGLFLAHNAAGGFYAAITMLSFHLFKGRWRIFLFCTLALAVVLSGSRGSLFALVAVIASLRIGLNLYFRWVVFSLLLVANLGLAAVSAARFGDAAMTLQGRAYSAQSRSLYQATRSWSEFVYGNSYNVFVRTVLLWSRSMRIWQSYPVFGGGFGGFDDFVDLANADGLFPKPTLILHSDSHAHNTWLNVLAEQGILGLVLLIWGLILIDRRLSERGDELGTAGSQVLLLLILMSFSEHRLFTPSNSVPVMYAVGLGLIRRYEVDRISLARRQLIPPSST